MTSRPSKSVFAILGCIGIGALLPLVDGACAVPSTVRVKRIEHRGELIGGPRALGEVGDWLFENSKVRIIVQDEGFSRGFGVFGGSLIDADLVREDYGRGNSATPLGKDNFGEMFPAFFLEAMEPYEINNPDFDRCLDDSECAQGESCESAVDDDATACTILGEAARRRLPAMEILDEGTESGTAIFAIRGYGNDFLAITQTANEGLLGDSREIPSLVFETRYTLRPDTRYIEIETKVQNIDPQGRELPFAGSLAGFEIPTPFGDVALFGAGNRLFVPHEAGHDLRYRLEEQYEIGKEFPALPGLVADYVASKGDDVSYGILAAPPEDEDRNFAFHTQDQFPDASPHSIHIPFIASAFTGVFQVLPPALSANDQTPGGDDEFKFKRYFIVGSGDVASVGEVVHEILGTETGKIVGQLLEKDSRAPIVDASVFVINESGKKITQMTTDAEGRFQAAAVRPGNYKLVPVAKSRRILEGTDIEVVVGKTIHEFLELEALATIVVTATEPGVGRLPVKVSVVGTVPAVNAGQEPREHLFDLSLGESILFSDMVYDEADPATRRYLEGFKYGADGTVEIGVRPGRYTVYVSRGIEYGRFETDVVVEAGQNVSVIASLERQVDTTDYIGADFHLHTGYSLDSDLPLDHAIAGYAAEGIEFAVSTDHNFIVDYAPVISDLGLESWIQSMVGLELTTIDRGHFNGFPLRVGDGRLIPTDEDGNIIESSYAPSNPLSFLGNLLPNDDTGGERDVRYGNTISSKTRGSFKWAQETPGSIFQSMRGIGRLDPTCLAENPFDKIACEGSPLDVIVQVNHPRDSILGYFEQYGVSADNAGAFGVPDPLFGPNTDFRPEFHARNFSYDFDAIEVFNGKRFEFIHSFRVPDDVTMDPVSCCPLTPGDIFRTLDPLPCDEEQRDCTCTPDDTANQIAAGTCDRIGDIAFPGVLEDWLLLLRSGKKVVGTANSDSHEPSKEEPGYPRTLVRVPGKVPGEVNADDVVNALKAGDALMTNGPYVRVSVDGAGMGEIATVSAGQATVHVEATCADWMSMNRVTLFVNGERLASETFVGDDGKGVRSIIEDITFDLPEDGFVVVEVTGDSNMFPTVYPNEIPPIAFSDVLSAIAGFGGDGEVLGPALTFPTTPFAITNPIWLDSDGDGEITPSLEIPQPFAEAKSTPNKGTKSTKLTGNKTPVSDVKPWRVRREGVTFSQTRAQLEARVKQLSPRKRALFSRMPAYLWPSSHPNDIRNVYFQFLRHQH
ncbi:MAG: CehA/McbA family metallohydrolase [Deltaproteobacteria bacterium]|nr:CehA/McbA family metallohydrolase [Deltaproteobacteria bacterium]